MTLDINSGEFVGSKFAKLYYSDIEKLFNLTAAQTNLFLLMAKSIGLGNKGSVNMTAKRKREFSKKLGLTGRNSISNMLRSMEKVDVLKRLDPEEYPTLYTVNPDIMFSGNEYQRVKILIDYSGGKRNVKVFASEDDAMDFLHELKEGKK